MEHQLRALVDQGRISEEQAKDRLRDYANQIHRQHTQRREISQEQREQHFAQVERQIDRLVESGKLSPEDAEHKLKELKHHLWGNEHDERRHHEEMKRREEIEHREHIERRKHIEHEEHLERREQQQRMLRKQAQENQERAKKFQAVMQQIEKAVNEGLLSPGDAKAKAQAAREQLAEQQERLAQQKAAEARRVDRARAAEARERVERERAEAERREREEVERLEKAERE